MEGLEGSRRGRDQSGDKTLRMTGSALQARAQITRSELSNTAYNQVLRELSEGDERERDGYGGEVGDWRAWRRAGKP